MLSSSLIDFHVSCSLIDFHVPINVSLIVQNIMVLHVRGFMSPDVCIEIVNDPREQNNLVSFNVQQYCCGFRSLPRAASSISAFLFVLTCDDRGRTSNDC